jgi:hypothetical protein
MSTKQKRAPVLPAAETRAVAVQAEVDPRTVRKLLIGGAVQPMPRSRIERVMRERGLEHLLKSRADGTRR